MKILLAARFIAALLVIALSAAQCGPGTFDISKVRDGMSIAEAEALVGKPDSSRDQTIPEGPFFGPAPKLPSGSPYTEWTYTRDRTVYLIWFSAGANGELRVIGTFNHPEGAVF